MNNIDPTFQIIPLVSVVIIYMVEPIEHEQAQGSMKPGKRLGSVTQEVGARDQSVGEDIRIDVALNSRHVVDCMDLSYKNR